MYFDYIKERQGLDHYKNDFGFFAYEIKDKEFYLAEMYIKPEHRGTSAVFDLYKKMEEIAKENSCNLISANIYLNDTGFHRTLKCAFNFLFTIVNAHNGCVTIVKKLEA